nr:VPLPA-CTERM sorting domain-containing protein [Amylibacter sp.]
MWSFELNLKNLSNGALVLGLGLALSSGTAGAASVTFDFTAEKMKRAKMLDFTQGGIGLTVSATKTNPKDVTSNSKVLVKDFGLGVKSGKKDNSAKIDSKGAEETVVFNFDSDVSIESITFSKFKKRDDFGFATSGLETLKGDVVETYTFTDDYTSNRFDVSALDTFLKKKNAFKGSSFAIASITVRSADAIPTVVPLPAGGMLLLGALGALGFTRRRKRAKA